MLAAYRPVAEPDPVGPKVDPLGEVLISELPEGFDGAPGPPVTALDWPVVVPGVLPAGPPGVEPLMPEEPLIPLPEDAPPDIPPTPPPAPPA